MRIKIPSIKHVRRPFRTPAIFVWLVFACWMVNAHAGPDTDQALFWSINKDGQTIGHLLGTIHSEDPRVLDFSDDLLRRLQDSQVYAMEMVPDLPTLARLTEYMRLPAGHSLEAVIGAGRFASLTNALSAYGVPSTFINRMKPWAAMMTLSTPPPITGFYMDLSLSLRASGSGLQVVGLETLEQQLSFLENMPVDMQLSLLDQAIDEFDQVGEAHDQMVDAYLENNLADLQSLSDEHLQEAGQEAKEYFMQTGIHDRNRRMVESILPHLADRTVFVAVGALHLVGEDGLLALLRQHGYELKPLALPFKKPQG
ncbi:MAG: TraB/GumN family protein [Xanthomonadales bacterium]|nr:TraB/GumN family protein [Xanthomonadales bacterium]